MLHPLSVAVLSILGSVTASASSLLCTDGSSPLIEANEAFPCAKGCPKGFVCEMQDPSLTPLTGICCPNRTELRMLYGNDNRKHTDPKWDQKDSTELSAPSTTTGKRPCSSSESDSSSTSPEEDDVPCGNITVTVSENDEVFDETSPASVTLDVQATVTSNPDATDSAAMDKGSHPGQSEVTQEQERMNSERENGDSVEEQSTSTALPLDVPGEREMQNGSATVGDTSDVDALEGSAVPVEVSIVVSSGKGDDDTLVEEPDLHGPDPQMELRSGKERSSDPSKVDHDTEGKAAATKNQDGPIALTGAGTKDLLPQDNTTVEALHEESNRTIDGPEHSSKDHIISKIGKEIRNDTMASINERTTYSCKKQPSRCLTDSVDAQPTIRWYLSEKGKCEYYSWRFCPGDRAAESLTIRTKADCERKCLKKRRGSSKKALPEALKGFSGKDEKALTDVQIQSNAQKPSGTPPIPAERNATVEQHGDLALEEKFGVESSTSELDKVLNETIVKQDLEDFDPREGSAVEPEIFTTTDDGSVLSNPSRTEEEESDAAQDHGMSAKTSQNQGTEREALNAVSNGAEENKVDKKLEKATETKVVKTEIEEPGQKGSEPDKGISGAGEEENKKVLCSRTTYRFFCKNGKPSHFVYRWERKNGACHSFPYGYCLHEWNHPHPRTPGECQLFC